LGLNKWKLGGNYWWLGASGWATIGGCLGANG